MNVICWNYQGVGNPLTVHSLKEQVKLHSPSLVFLSETKNRRARLEDIKRRLGFEWCFVVDPRGLSGGLCLLWKTEAEVKVVQFSEFLIEAVVDMGPGKPNWRFMGFYASTDDAERRRQLHALSIRLSLSTESCVMGGDFNDILNSGEKEGGLTRSLSNCCLLSDFLFLNDLSDMSFLGYPFTWSNRRKGMNLIKMRLDRFVVSGNWSREWPKARVHHLTSLGSDHRMIVLQLAGIGRKFQHRFIYNKEWTSNKECKQAMEGAWAENVQGRSGFVVAEKIRKTRLVILEWRRKAAVNSGQEMKRLETEVQAEQNRLDPNYEKIYQMEQQLKKAVVAEEAYWRAKSRVQRLGQGDRNTKFFHAKVTVRRRRRALSGIEDEAGVWCEGEEEVARVGSLYFASLFKSSQPLNFDGTFDRWNKRLDGVDNNLLTQGVTQVEIESAIYGINPDKAPGADGMTSAFFQENWLMVKEDITRMVLDFFQEGRLFKKLNHTHIILIPKVRLPTKMAQLRLISLCNVAYKIISKNLCNRLKRVLPKLVSECQTAFVQGRAISDNILVAHEILHSMKQRRGNDRGYMAVKLDMAKAYDRIEWSFLERVMMIMGFDPKWIGWIMECVSTVSYSLVVNNKPYGNPLIYLCCVQKS